jgi:hypothetical protein
MRKTALRRTNGFKSRGPKFNSRVTTLYLEDENGEMRKATYASRYESGYAKKLNDMLRQKKISAVKEQHRVRLMVNGKHVCTHIPDFLVTLNDGRQKIVEAKGYPMPEWKLKKKLFEALYPELPYLVNPDEETILR